MNELNSQQQAVVDSNESKILVLAGAGAGKTHTMLSRISRLVKDGCVPSSILVLTFTNKAAFDMRERYKAQQLNKHNVPEFRTFHSFCYHILVKDRSVREYLGYAQPPGIASASQSKRIATEAKLQSGVTLTSDKLSGKVPCRTPKDIQDLKIHKKCLNRLLKKENLTTFDILAQEVSQLFTEDHELARGYKDRYKYIFVDEFQDTDPQQFKFVESFNRGTQFCLIGDSLQCIYQFRGCSNEFIKALSKDDSWTHIRLYKNYRSTNQICQFANNMSSYADPEYRIEMEGQRDGAQVQVIPGSYVTWEDAVDLNHVSNLISNLKKPDGSKDVAVLCRTNKEVKFICEKLKAANILFSSGNRNQDALHILKSVSDNDYMLDWLSSFLPAEKYADFIRLAAQVEVPDIKWFAKEYNDVPDISERGKTIISIRRILKSDSLPISKAADILKALGMKPNESLNIESDDLILSTLIDTIEDQGDSEIYVGTIHSSKGLEYDTVYIMGVDDKSFQLGTEDMNNLYYVAITRAKNHLIIYSA